MSSVRSSILSSSRGSCGCVGTSNVGLVVQAWMREPAAADAVRSDLLRALHDAFMQQKIAFADR
jgi:hypothetical protein